MEFCRGGQSFHSANKCDAGEIHPQRCACPRVSVRKRAVVILEEVYNAKVWIRNKSFAS